ncbi:aminotransferase [Polaribacter pacificus]|uniref:Aminotransferase n=1 Tax=Polaribacter pacificus TaxID=1775173 RepID=A0A917HS54_9FLAO|nr:aminotransferase class V-fold PLP-dependent enzyme [Polaribacter pacificus]GGG87844.1 aminotransferase [Polaribacter pacificus]
MKLQEQRSQFEIPSEVSYLNIASLSPSFKTVEKAGLDAVKEKSQPFLIPSLAYFDPVKELKQLFANLIQAPDLNRIAPIPSVSYGMATVANNIKLKKGDEILLIEEQFPSNYYVWEKLAQKFEAQITIIPKPKQNKDFGKLWNEAILNAISDKTALIALGNIHWVHGTIFDLKAIRKKTKAHKALLIVDGSQSVGALPFSVLEIDPDALICAGYKWLFGPYGCAYAYFGSYFDEGQPIEENWSNRLDSENLSGLTNYQSKYKPLANRYAVGEHASFIYVKMQIAALKQLIAWSPKSIQEYCASITLDAVKELQEAGFYIAESEQRAQHLFGVELPERLNQTALKERLAEENIYVSFRGNSLRISCHLFNTKEDLKKLSTCLIAALD